MRRKNRESSRMRRALPSAKFANRIFSGRPASAPAHRLRRPLRGQPDWKKCWRIFLVQVFMGMCSVSMRQISVSGWMGERD